VLLTFSFFSLSSSSVLSLFRFYPTQFLNSS